MPVAFASDMRQLNNKIAIVTGADGGIGSASARLPAARGARIVLADIHLPAALLAASSAR